MVSVDGQTVRLSSPTKVMWPPTDGHREVTKIDLVDYLKHVAGSMLPQVKGRPLTVVRYPNGIQGQRIFQKNWRREPPEYVRTVAAPADKPGGALASITVENAATLLWLAQMNVVELHPWLSRVSVGDAGGDPFDLPDLLVFDLDPFVPMDEAPLVAKPPLTRAGFAKAVKVAVSLRTLLDQWGLDAYVKTSGKTGLHVYVPIERRYPFRVTRALAEAVGERLARDWPEDVTLAHAISDRRGKVLVDYGQNGKGKNQVALFSPRATELATVSMPIAWDDLASVYPTDFTIPTLSGMAQVSNPWSRFFDHPGRLERALKAFSIDG